LKLAVVILNWNGKQLLEQFLPAMINHSQKVAKIYIADNASTDNSIEFIRSNYPQVKIIQNSNNGGYAKGYNESLRHIDADIYALVNSDIEVTEDWIQPIIEEFKISEKTAIIQPKILDFNNKTKFEYAGAAGGYLDFFGYPYCRGRVFNSLENDNNQYNDTTDIFWASGACFFIRSSVFHQLDGFDEQFFAHQEEIDLCWRAKNEDFNIKYIGTSTVFHIGGATLNEASPRKTFLNFRNSLFTATKNLPKRYLFLVIFSRLLLDAVAGIKFIIDLKPLHTWAIIKEHFSFYRFMPAMIKKRQKTSYKSNEYYQCKSVVWQHFILGRRKFDQIN